MSGPQGLKVLAGVLENHTKDGKECLDAVRRMMGGAKKSIRTELVAQLEEQVRSSACAPPLPTAQHHAAVPPKR